MGLRVVGAGLPRTGTTSLKAALEQLLDGSCYHMIELNDRVDSHGPLWTEALDGDLDSLDQLLEGWVAAVDWPASLFWRELAERHPDALVVLSHRGSAEIWWNSVDQTVWENMRRLQESSFHFGFSEKLRNRAGFGDGWDDAAAAMARYDSLYDEVVDVVPASRLLIWEPSQGWEPMCSALGVPVPQTDFFHRNSAAEFRQRSELG